MGETFEVTMMRSSYNVFANTEERSCEPKEDVRRVFIGNKGKRTGPGFPGWVLNEVAA